MCRLAVALAGVLASVAPRVEAAWVSVGAPAQVAAGWTRIAGHYESVGVEPAFRVIARCADGEAGVYVLDPLVHLAPKEGALWLDLPGTPDRLVPADTPCEAPELSIEMLVDAIVVASAPVPGRRVTGSGLHAALLALPAVPAQSSRRLRPSGQKDSAPFSKRTEVGLEWLLDSRVSFQLNYERTSQPPMMPFDHDDGFLTRLRVGF